ncbi:major intracellular serine protease [Salibacterium salarium]|uniref:S8 family peptidase n=1 Tax=Salibacterium salarium TaxID=284579 RepID=UPI00277E0AAE|nr:S8 family peptidase [Salibacterium salarium]MDQ0297735.1 major intracellular serine protease [Salibacterium salarium]
MIQDMHPSNNTNSIPWGVNTIGAPDLWDRSYHGEGTVVAIIDSGCDIHHRDLHSNIIDWFNFTDNNDPYVVQDTVSHGTHIAGIIAANNHSNGIIGVAPSTKLLILKAFDSVKINSFSAVIEAIYFAMNWKGKNGEKVNIINLSLGSTSENPELKKALARAKEENIFIVGASGNYGSRNDSPTKNVLYPSYFSEVIQVGAIDEDRKIAPFSNENDKLNFLAPGVHVLSTAPNNKHVNLSGTSMAAAHVSGVLSLVLNIYSSDEINQVIKKQAKGENVSLVHCSTFVK